MQANDVSVSLDAMDGVVELIEQHRARLACIGEVSILFRECLEDGRQCGLDFKPRYIKSEQDKTIQREVLAQHIALASRLDLALYVPVPTPIPHRAGTCTRDRPARRRVPG